MLRRAPTPLARAPRRSSRRWTTRGDGGRAGRTHRSLCLSVDRQTWRCFPWDDEAAEGAPFSRSYLVPGQRVGRFDLKDAPPVRYLADTPDHAIAETLSGFRGTDFRESYLRKSGYPLALVEITLAASLVKSIPDCTDPQVLSAHGLRPDQLAHHERSGEVGFGTPQILHASHPVLGTAVTVLGIRRR